jgi:transposase
MSLKQEVVALRAEVSRLNGLVAVLLSRIEILEAENAVLKTENLALKQENAQLRRENAELKQKVTSLEIRLNQNSGNSHKPPSTDGFKKKPALPKSKGKPSGGQAGHKGHYLEMVATPDEVVVHHASNCSCCGKSFTSHQVCYIEEKRQIFDMPPVKLQVTEHQLGVIYCCGKAHTVSFPQQLKAPVAYGERLHAMASLLNTEYRLPMEKVSQLFADLWGCSYNESTLLSANNRLYEQLQPMEEDIKKKLLESAVLHVDESGMRVEGRLQWVHTACTALLCYLFVHPKRGREALYSRDSVLKDYHHRAIHDCWKIYFSFDKCQHALCNAHLIRELRGLQEQGSQWALEMEKLLLELYGEREKGHLVANKSYWLEKYQLICQRAEEQEPIPEAKGRGRPKNTKGRNLLVRLMEHKQAVLAFAFEPGVPFTNNLAEQAIRCVKIKQKVAMSFRTYRGAQVFARIQGFISTCRKQNMNAFQQLVEVLKGNMPVFQGT